MTDTEKERQPDTTTHDSIPAKTGKNDEDRTSGDCISRQAAIDKFIDDLEEIFSDIREREVDDSVCGLCEYDGAYMGQSGDWCNECPGFDRDDCFKLSDETRKKWTDEIIKALPSVQPDLGKYEYHYDHTDCIWYRPEARNRCPVTCAQYRDGWNDAMNYIFRDGKGYRPYRRGEQYE